MQGMRVSERRPDISPAKMWAFRIVMILTVPLFFLLVEGGLRLGGYGEDTPLFVERQVHGHTYLGVNPRVVGRYFGDVGFETYTSRDLFRPVREEGVYRIFFLGASTTIGYPYLFNGSPSAMLKAHLDAWLPEQPVEVINVGITAVNSFVVADLMKEVLAQDPDLIIVYSGHNEFYGPFGIGSADRGGMRPALARAYLGARRLRTVQLLESGIRRSGGSGSGDAEATLMERLARDRSIAYGSSAYTRTMDAYEQNLERMARAARRRGVPLMLATVASNVRDQEPFVSLQAPGQGEEGQAEMAVSLAAARDRIQRSDAADARAMVEEILAQQPGHAGGHFLLGRVLEMEGRPDEAAAAYRRARDLDALRFRASGDLNERVRRVAAAEGVYLADVEEAFDRRSDGMPGRRHFWEHVHPTLDGYRLMGRTFAEALREAGLPAPADRWAAGEAGLKAPPGAVTPLDERIAEIRIGMLTRRWPFRAEPAPYEFRPATLLDSLAWQYVNGGINWYNAHHELARRYAAEGRREEAVAGYRALATAAPTDAGYHALLGDALALTRDYAGAAKAFERALGIAPAAGLHLKLGVCLFETGNYSGAVAALETALSDRLPDAALLQAHGTLGRALIRLGRHDEAAAHLALLQRNAPSAPLTRVLLHETIHGVGSAPVHDPEP
jgi:tetratricopeptide (TPR) repeat protein